MRSVRLSVSAWRHVELKSVSIGIANDEGAGSIRGGNWAGGPSSFAVTQEAQVIHNEVRAPEDQIICLCIRRQRSSAWRRDVFEEFDARPTLGPQSRDSQPRAEDLIQVLLFSAVVLRAPDGAKAK